MGVCALQQIADWFENLGISEMPRWFTEGFDTLDLKEAKTLLDALA